MTFKKIMHRREFMTEMATKTSALLGSFAYLGRKSQDLNLNELYEKADKQTASTPDFSSIRADFPITEKTVWLASAETHPFNIYILKAIEDYCKYRTLGVISGSKSFTTEMQQETKQMFANLIGSKPEEIAFTMSTTDGENIIVAGLDLARRGGNVVIDDLHFIASNWMYSQMQKKGLIELRVVKHKEDWTINLEDMAKAIDKNTRLVSLAVVSNINGYLHDMTSISNLAHMNGAIVYGDIIQGAGNTPINVNEMGLDCCACSTYKWLMGDFGIGFLYIKENLQDSAIKATRYGLRQIGGKKGSEYYIAQTAARYEGTTSIPYLPGICAYQGLKYISKIGVENIRDHAKPLIDRVRNGMKSLGYTCITPPNNPTPIISFLVPHVNDIIKKLEKVFGNKVVSPELWEIDDGKGHLYEAEGIRISVSVFNNASDIERFLDVLR